MGKQASQSPDKSQSDKDKPKRKTAVCRWCRHVKRLDNLKVHMVGCEMKAKGAPLKNTEKICPIMYCLKKVSRSNFARHMKVHQEADHNWRRYLAGTLDSGQEDEEEDRPPYIPYRYRETALPQSYKPFPPSSLAKWLERSTMDPPGLTDAERYRHKVRDLLMMAKDYPYKNQPLKTAYYVEQCIKAAEEGQDLFKQVRQFNIGTWSIGKSTQYWITRLEVQGYRSFWLKLSLYAGKVNRWDNQEEELARRTERIIECIKDGRVSKQAIHAAVERGVITQQTAEEWQAYIP